MAVASDVRPAPAGPLTVFHAGSLDHAFEELLQEFVARNPGVDPRSESSGSVEAARKLTDWGKIPDVVATADYAVIEQLLMPEHTRWYVTFASNAMVLAHTGRSAGANEITRSNWVDVLLRAGVRIGRSDPALDPGGYRTLMVFDLAEHYYRRPGLARQLVGQSPAIYTRPKEVELIALLEGGEIDYAILYRSIVKQSGLLAIAFPREIDLSDPAHRDNYARATVTIPRSARGSDSLVFRGEPIGYGLTVPARAPNPDAARSFARFVLGPDGRAILERAGFVLPPEPELRGDTVEAARWVR